MFRYLDESSWEQRLAADNTRSFFHRFSFNVATTLWNTAYFMILIYENYYE